MRFWIFGLFALLAACGPNIGSLQKGETGTVARVYNGDTVELDNGMRIFLAEIDAPRADEPYASQARQELEALALHRKVQLAYGGTRRWTPRPREGAVTATSTTTSTPPRETAIAHLFVQSEGGRWIWLQEALIARGAAFVHTRHDNHARTTELLTAEQRARVARRGLWADPAYAALSPAAAVAAAAGFTDGCRGHSRFAFVEGRIKHADVQDRRALLDFDGAPFDVAIFGQTFANWDGPAFETYQSKRVRVRGRIGLFHEHAEICVDSAQQIEVMN